MDMNNIRIFLFCNKTLQDEKFLHKFLVKKHQATFESQTCSLVERHGWFNKSEAIARCP